MVSRRIALSLEIFGFVLSFLAILLLWIFPYYLHSYRIQIGLPLGIGGIVGLVVFGISLTLVCKSEANSAPSTWRLAEKIIGLVGFLFMILVWLSAAYKYSLGEHFGVFIFLGIVLTAASILSNSERVSRLPK